MLYIGGFIGAIAAVALAVSLSGTPEDASGLIAHGERVVYHWHAVVEYYVDGVKQDVPGNIGVPLDGSHPLAQYGPSGIAPIHTHERDGVIHMESKVQRDYTFGDFLDLWGLDLADKTASLVANNQPVADMRNHVLQDQDMLRLEVTTATGPTVP